MNVRRNSVYNLVHTKMNVHRSTKYDDLFYVHSSFIYAIIGEQTLTPLWSSTHIDHSFVFCVRFFFWHLSVRRTRVCVFGSDFHWMEWSPQYVAAHTRAAQPTNPNHTISCQVLREQYLFTFFIWKLIRCNDGHVIDGHMQRSFMFTETKMELFRMHRTKLCPIPDYMNLQTKVVRIRNCSITHWSIYSTKIDVDAFMRWASHSREN